MKIKFIILYTIFILSAVFSVREIYSSFAVLQTKAVEEKAAYDYEKVKEALKIVSGKMAFAPFAEPLLPSLALEEVKVSILNGSGVAGAASELKERLEEKSGFTVLAVGNYEATNSSTVKAKKIVSEETVKMIVDLLKEDYGKVESEALSEGENEEIVIILGSE